MYVASYSELCINTYQTPWAEMSWLLSEALFLSWVLLLLPHFQPRPWHLLLLVDLCTGHGLFRTTFSILSCLCINPSPLADHSEPFRQGPYWNVCFGKFWVPWLGILLVAVWIESIVPCMSTKTQTKASRTIDELSGQKAVFIHFINLSSSFFSSSRVWNGLWLSSMNYLTNPSWIFPGKMDSF